MDERELTRMARRLAAEGAARIDPERVARRVVGRLRAEPPAAPAPWWRRTPVLRAAAVAAVLVSGSLLARAALTDGDPVAVASDVPFMLEDLSVGELDEVLDSLTVEAPVHEAMTASLYDLNEEQLLELLAEMEG